MSATQTTSRTKITPPQLARRWGVASDKIVHFIRTGELRAIDVSTRRGGRPRYLIDERDIEAFEQARSVQPITRPTRRKRSQPQGVVEYF